VGSSAARERLGVNPGGEGVEVALDARRGHSSDDWKRDSAAPQKAFMRSPARSSGRRVCWTVTWHLRGARFQK